MTKRGKRSSQKRREKDEFIIYRGRLRVPNQKWRGLLAGNSGFGAGSSRSAAGYVESSSSGSEPEEYAMVGMSKRNAVIPEVKRPNLVKMSEWTAEQFLQYDRFLIQKWEYIGWVEKDAGYVSIKDKNSAVAKYAREKFNKP
ncbi:uncharacterized protein LOC112081634 [Eutrema salsugineum]|uniref:uncharacterized protein LOC112081634 n=1 Tax=Eutrema salsugineum TaxID=72664 RepID=UPI000CED60F3|nr:uncharacterized protein LOC112081634 [Eutrema salsugineum]XP_024004221.1 uncharacterized protein LOC112081634 [Eutrema salsugineum]